MPRRNSPSSSASGSSANDANRPQAQNIRQSPILHFLPPCSPDFNPVENAFARLKALLRAKAERTTEALRNPVGPLLDVFTPAECANYFKAAGYDPD